MNIQLEGLTPKQVALCDIMWTINSFDGVQNFIRSLPPADQRDCRTLVELMQLAFTDEVETVDEARELLARF
jgi:hypothetical protein